MPSCFALFLFLLFNFLVLKTEPRASSLLGNHSTTELNPQAPGSTEVVSKVSLGPGKEPLSWGREVLMALSARVQPGLETQKGTRQRGVEAGACPGKHWGENFLGTTGMD